MHYRSSNELSFSLSPSHLQVKTFKDYVELYLRGQSSEDEDELPRKVVHEVVNPRWEVAVTASNGGFQQASFINSIATTKVRIIFIIRCVYAVDWTRICVKNILTIDSCVIFAACTVHVYVFSFLCIKFSLFVALMKIFLKVKIP